jgi:hypothetical protein
MLKGRITPACCTCTGIIRSRYYPQPLTRLLSHVVGLAPVGPHRPSKATAIPETAALGCRITR